MTPSPDDCAREILDVVPLVMRVLRSEMRSHRSRGLSVPHFRVLAFLDKNEGASLSAVADSVGLRLPSMSTLVNGLVDRGLVTRAPSASDRRRLALCLTARGRSNLETARRATQARLSDLLREISTENQATVASAMQILRPLFEARRGPEDTTRNA